MANKEVPLSIVLRTVDKATAGINAVNKKLAGLTKPLKDLSKASDELKENFGVVWNATGIPRVASAVAGVGGAVKDLVGKALVLGGAMAAAVAGVMSLVDEFDGLGDKAEAAGVSVDFLAQLRYAAERSGASVDQLDGGVRTLALGMGQLRAGTGKFKSFIDTLPPIMGRQLKATKSNEEAFNLLANAMRKIQDPAKRALFAQKTLGDASLAPLLAKGAKGVQELRDEHLKSAGSMEDAAAAAGEVDDSMKHLTAATSGVKAALVKGLSPALKVVIEKMTEWLIGHREDIKRWAEDIGTKLPGAVDRVVKAGGEAVAWVKAFVDRIGGSKVALAGLAAVMVGPLISAFTTLGVAMLTTPFGAVLASLAAISALVISIIGEIEKMSAALDTSHEKALERSIMRPGETIEEFEARTANDPELAKVRKFRAENQVGSAVENLNQILGRQDSPEAPQGSPAAIPRKDLDLGLLGSGATHPFMRPQPQEARIKVDFANAPRGTRVQADPQSTADVDLSVGYQMIGAGT